MEAIVLAKAATEKFAENNDAITMIRDLPVTNDAEASFASEGVQQLKEWYAELEKERTSITKPINEGLRRLNDHFRPMKTALEEAERAVKARIAGYLADKQRRNTAAIEAAAAAATAEQAERALATVSPVEAPRGTSVRYQWVAEIVDASLLPREYMTPDMYKIVDAVRASDGQVHIPGVVVRKEQVIASLSRRRS